MLNKLRLSIVVTIVLSLGISGHVQANSKEMAELHAMIIAQQEQLDLLQQKLDSISADVVENSNKTAESNQKRIGDGWLCNNFNG